MRSVETFTTLAVSTFALLFSVNTVFSDVVWTANIASSPNPATAAIGGSFEFWLEDEKFDITGLPDHESWTRGDETTEYRWTVNGGAVEGNGSSATISSGNNGDVGAGKHSISFEGKTGYFICWTDEENNQQSDGPYQVGWLSLGSKGFTVVKVASVSCSGVTSTTGMPGVAETVCVAIGETGSSIAFTTTSYPPDSWPAGTPIWSISNPDGSSSSEQTSVNARTDSAGAFTVSASCGTSAAAILLNVIEVYSLEPDIGEEIDDEDENPDTRTFVVCASDDGGVNVNATPNPSVHEYILPDEWSLTGGTGTGKLQRTIDRTTAGSHSLACNSGASHKTTTIIILSVLSILPNVGQEIDDGDENVKTKVFLVPTATDSDVVTVTATIYPALNETDIPSNMTIIGGAGSEQLLRTVSRLSTSKTEFTFHCCDDSEMRTTLYVYSALIALYADKGNILGPEYKWGHSWWRMSVDQDLKVLIKDLHNNLNNDRYFGTAGWWPNMAGDPVTLVPVFGWCASAPGIVVFGTQNHESTGAKVWKVEYDQLMNALYYIYSLENSDKMWDVYNDNCTDEAIYVGNQAGITTISTQGITKPEDLSNWLNAN